LPTSDYAASVIDGIVQSWNVAAERLFGYSAAEMIGQSITKIVPSDRLDEETFVLAAFAPARTSIISRRCAGPRTGASWTFL
jgi:PAS domain S-box-containing protein